MMLRLGGAWYKTRKGRATRNFPIGPGVTDAAFSMDWEPGRARFSSTLAPGQWVTLDEDIATQPQRLSINLWLFHAPAPSDGKESEFMIKAVLPATVVSPLN